MKRTGGLAEVVCAGRNSAGLCRGRLRLLNVSVDRYMSGRLL